MSDEKDLSLREEILAAFNESETAEPETETPDAEQSAADNEQQDKSDSETQAKAPESAKEKLISDGEKPDDSANAEKPEAIKPPDKWTKEEKETFSALDPEVQRILMTRNKGLEASYTKKMMDLAQQQQRYGAIDEALSPHRESWSGTGWDDATALKNIMGYWQHAQQDPMGFIQQFAEARGIDLASQFAPSADEILAYLNQGGQLDAEGNPLPATQPPPVHPDVQRQMQQYEQRINALTHQVQQQTSQMTYAEQQRMQQERAVAEQQLNEFVNAVDENGAPKHEFYEDLKPEMIRMMEGGLASSLEDAYQRALWGNESTRQKVFESQEIQRRRDQERKAQHEAEAARRASSSVASAGAPPAPPTDDEEDLSVRALLEREMRRSSERASGLI